MRLLIAGSLKGQLTTASKIAMDNGAKVAHAGSIDMALNVLRSGRGADLIMADVMLNIEGLIGRLEAEHIHIPVVACGVESDTKAAVAAIRAGAREYIPLPPDPELIAAVISAVASDGPQLIFSDPAMAAVIQMADQVAPSDASVLITGESGTGKEVVAQYLHQNSKRADKPFISINCAAIPDNLLESELFGHEKGAFTGAVARRIGKFEEANGGTLLLDEISEMDVKLQAKLLRAIQEKVIDRVGGNQPVPVNIRIVATSNRNLVSQVRAGEFREDLLYRLNVINLRLPPLRERKEDIRLLAVYFSRQFAKINGLADRPLTEAAMEQLQANYWPGNVRELENTIHRAVLLAGDGEIEASAILAPDGVPLTGGRNDPASKAMHTAEAISRALVGRTVADVECELILDTLDHCLGNRTHAAKILGISIRTLRNKLNQYVDEGLQVPLPGDTRLSAAG